MHIRTTDIAGTILPSGSPAAQWGYFDIETLGLNRSLHPILVIGSAVPTPSGFQLTQSILEHPSDERMLLEHFVQHCPTDLPLVTFNGIAFDGPYLNQRLRISGLNCRIPSARIIDTLRWAKQTLKGLPNYRLKTVEAALGFHREDEISGKECILLFERYLSNPSQDLLDLILLHNRDDIVNMIPLAHRLTDACRESRAIPWRIQAFQTDLWFQSGSRSGSILHLTFESDAADFTTPPYYMHGFTLETAGVSIHLQLPVFELDFPEPGSCYLDIRNAPGFSTVDFNTLPIAERLALRIWHQDHPVLPNLAAIMTRILSSL